MITKICLNCEKKFYVVPSQKETKFCCRNCFKFSLRIKGKCNNKAWLKKQYQKNGLTMQEIASSINVKLPTIQRRLQEFKIPRRKPCPRGKVIIITPKTHEIIEGCLLGDGSMRAIKHSVQFRYASKHKDCILYLKHLLKKTGIKNQKISFSGGVWHYDTVFYRKGLWNLRKQWYPDGRKTIPKLFKLTNTKLLWWHLGDGYICKKQKRITLATNGFSKIDISILTNELNKMGIDCSAYQNKIPKYYGAGLVISIYSNAVNRFIDTIGKCPMEIKNCFGYKWIIYKARNYLKKSL